MKAMNDTNRAYFFAAVCGLCLALLACSNPSGGGGTPTPVVTGVSITSTATEAVKGFTLALSARVNWSSGAATNESVWTLSGASHPKTKITPNGLLTVNIGETSGEITVRAAYAANPAVGAEKTLTVKNPDTAPNVTGIAINGDSSVAKGGAVSLTADVTTDTDGADASVTWSITTAGTAAGTVLGNVTGSSAVLHVDSGETNTSIKVKIVSNLDDTQTAEKTVTVTAPPPPPPPSQALDFTTEANANLLGLYPGAAGYAGAAAVIDAMDWRRNAGFYNITTSGVDVPPDVIYGITGVKRDNVAGAAPAMAWIINGDDFIVHGYADHNPAVVFNVAVINAATGTGWVTGDADNAPYGNTYRRAYTGQESEKIPIASLTNGEITSAAGLGGYRVYVIVRGMSALPQYDFNDPSDPYNTWNVIAVALPSSPPQAARAFNFTGNPAELGLSPYGTYTAASVITAMDGRAAAALTSNNPGGNIFYNPNMGGISDSFTHADWTYGDTTQGLILGNAPGMRWVVNGNVLAFYGSSNVGATITFNAAVIEIATGKGWLYGDTTDTAVTPPLTGVVKETYTTPHVRTIPLSALTNGALTNTAGLGDGTTTGYKVYIIVRMTDSYPVVGDFSAVIGSRNVIAVHPEPEY